jgi:hypothetical protein
MVDDPFVTEVAVAPSLDASDETAVLESVVLAVAAGAAGVGGLAGGVAAVANTIHHWRDGRAEPDRPAAQPEPQSHLVLPPGVDLTVDGDWDEPVDLTVDWT